MSKEIKLNKEGASDAASKMGEQKEHLQRASDTLVKAAEALAKAGQGAAADAAAEALGTLCLSTSFLFDTSGVHASFLGSAVSSVTEADARMASAMMGGPDV